MTHSPFACGMQHAADNPGWKGSGTPSLRSLLIGRPHAAARDLARGRPRTALHNLTAAATDFWNFHGPHSGRPRRACPCCGWTGPAFLAAANWRAVAFQSRCPACDSRSRHRGLVAVLPELLARAPAGSVLVFAPERILLEFLGGHAMGRRIATTDYRSIDVDHPGEDIQRLSFTPGTFSIILCNHVLEHVPDDRAALRECARVLVPGGIALFTVPGDFPSPATRHFAEPDDNGHLRHYGMDLMDAMRGAFTEVEALDMSRKSGPEAGVRRHDLAFWCTR